MKNPAFCIGYWARCNDLQLEDVRDREPFEQPLERLEDVQAFLEGWHIADEELTDEKIRGLVNDLRVAGFDPATGRTLTPDK